MEAAINHAGGRRCRLSQPLVTIATEAPSRTRPGLSGSVRTKLFAYALVAPVVLLILGLVAYPFLFAVWVSFNFSEVRD